MKLKRKISTNVLGEEGKAARKLKGFA